MGVAARHSVGGLHDAVEDDAGGSAYLTVVDVRIRADCCRKAKSS